MAIDVSGFSTPEKSYSGLYQIGKDLREQQDNKDTIATAAKTKKAGSMAYLSGYLDPKHFLTGTNYDPVITNGLSGLLQKGASLAQEGLDPSQLTMALGPEVANLSKASQNIQALDRQREESLAHMSKIKGIDPDKYNNEFKKAAFYDANGNLKDMSAIDPNQSVTDQVLKNADVYNNEGYDDYVAKSGKVTENNNVVLTDARGGRRKTMADMTYPTFMQPETGAHGEHLGFVPKYVTVADGDGELMHTFKGDKGEDIKAPVRAVTDEVFNALPTALKSKVRYEVMQHIKNNPDLHMNTTQAEMLAKSFAYDDLKNSGKQYATLKETREVKQPPAPRNTFNINTGSQQQQPFVNLYDGPGGLKEELASHNGVRQMNLLPTTIQSALLAQANKGKEKGQYNETNVQVEEAKDGNIYVVNAETNQPIFKVDPISLNLPVNTALNKFKNTKTTKGIAPELAGQQHTVKTAAPAPSGVKWKK